MASFVLPRFYPIVDTALIRLRGFSAAAVAEEVLAAGARILQYRHKDGWTQRDYDEAEQVNDLCRKADATFVLNDRADYAHLIGAAALHLGQDDLPAPAARKVVGDQVIIGFSTHNKRQLVFASDAPVEYLALGPVFATASKLKPDPVLGLDGFRQLRSLAKKPLAAIGGITLANAAAVLEAGADSVAILSGILPEGENRNGVRAAAQAWIALTR